MIKKTYGFFSRKRNVVVISHKGIKSKEIGFLFCFWNLLLILWIFFTTVKYFEYRQTLVNKDLKINKLTYSNATLKNDLKSVGLVKQYIESLNQYERFNTVEAGDNSFALNLDKKELDNKYSSKLAYVLDREDTGVKDINIALVKRIKGLEKVVENTGLDIDDVHQVAFKNKKGSRDLDIVQDDNNFDKQLLRVDATNSIKQNIDYLTYLETLIEKMPLRTPINNYYITSGFGGRRDPFNGAHKTHKGLDMAGPINAQIHTPSDGKVVFSGSKGGYGRSIAIDHGNGLRTEYGHLKRILVQKGDKVKKGQAIGVQGNTGKSTGTHLHYEIQYNKKPINPKYFIKVGDEIF